MSIINFTVEYDQFASATDGVDGGVDADIIALVGSCTFTPVFADDKPVLAPSYDPRPAGFKVLPFIGYIDSDGQLKSRPGGDVGVRLWANDPVLELESLTYRVDFNLRTPLGKPVVVEGGYLVAPSTDVTLNLADVLEPTGVASVQGLEQQLVYADEIQDATEVGVDLITAASSAVVQAAAATIPTAIKTAAYTAAVGELVPADAASGGFTVTLPAAPASGSTVWVKKIDTTTNTVTVQRGNSTDVFNETNGPTLLQLAVAGESVQVQYKSGIWYVVAHSFAVPGLDKRYVQQGPHPAANSYSINDLNGASVLAVIGTADAANHLQVENSTLGNRVRIRAEGEDNVNFEMRPKGTGGVFINSGAGNDLVGFVPIASAVNSWSFNNSTTGNPIRCAANGSNASVSFNFVPKGSGNFQVNGTAVLLTGGELGTPSSGTLTNCTFPTLNQNTTGTAAGLSSTLVVGSGGTGATTLTGLVKGNGSSAMTAAVAGTDFIAPGGALGTPSSGTLTNATGLPVSGITASTSAALGVGSIELGHATDTTVTRSAAGVLAVEGVDLVNLSSAQTLVGKTFTFHNQADRTTNFEQTYLGYSGNNFLISNTNGGTGSRRPIVFQSGATVTVDSGNSSSGVVRISASTGSAGNMAFAVGGTFTNSSGITYGTHLNHTMSQTGTGGYTSLLINPTELSNTGTGAKILIDAMVGGSSKFTVSNAGSVTLADAATLAVGTSTGTKIATATTQKLGFWNASPAVQPTAVADATDAATVITQLNSLLSRLRTIGLIAT